MLLALAKLYINLAFGVTKWKQKREQEIEENGKRRAGMGSKFMSFQTVICSGPGMLLEGHLTFQDEVCFYPQGIHVRGRPVDV